MANTIGTVDINNKIKTSSYQLIKNEKEVNLMNGKKRTRGIWYKYKYTIEFENQTPQLYQDLADLIDLSPMQTLILDKDPWGTSLWLSTWKTVYCKLSDAKHTAGRVVSNKLNYRVTFQIECEEVDPR